MGSQNAFLRLRQHLGWTQADMAAEVGCTRAMWGLIEQGRRQPSRDLIRMTCDVFEKDFERLGISVRDLL